MKQRVCSPNMHIGEQDNCPHWHRICFSEWGVFNDNHEMIGDKKGQWGYCDLLDKKFLYVLGTDPACETTRQTTLM